jgi:hypothetical protein
VLIFSKEGTNLAGVAQRADAGRAAEEEAAVIADPAMRTNTVTLHPESASVSSFSEAYFFTALKGEQINSLLFPDIINLVERNDVAFAALEQRCGHQETYFRAPQIRHGFQGALLQNLFVL